MSNNTMLRDTIDLKFSYEELKSVCFDLQIDFDNRAGETKQSKIAEMIQFLSRRDRLDELVAICVKLRPSVNWFSISGIEPEKSQTESFTNLLPHKDFSDKNVELFLQASNLGLTAIDGSILTYIYPFQRKDWGWREDEVSLIHDDSLVDDELPHDFLELSRSFRTAKPKYKDSIKYCADKMSYTFEENGQLIINARSIRYLTSYPTADYLASAPWFDNPIRQKWFSRLVKRQSLRIPNMLIAHVLVLTGDKKLILQKRSSNVHYFPGSWSASFEEHYNAPWQKYLKPGESFEETIDKSMFDGIHRGLREELLLAQNDISQTIIRILGVGFEPTNFHSNVYAIAELPKHLTFDAISHNLRLASEHDNYVGCKFDVQNLLNCIKQGEIPADLKSTISDAKWSWHPTSRMRIYLALMRHMGPNELLRYFQ